jgi:CHASE3 domain sensor protein
LYKIFNKKTTINIYKLKKKMTQVLEKIFNISKDRKSIKKSCVQNKILINLKKKNKFQITVLG